LFTRDSSCQLSNACSPVSYVPSKHGLSKWNVGLQRLCNLGFYGALEICILLLLLLLMISCSARVVKCLTGSAVYRIPSWTLCVFVYIRMQRCASTAHPYCNAYVNSAFYPSWDGTIRKRMLFVDWALSRRTDYHVLLINFMNCNESPYKQSYARVRPAWVARRTVNEQCVLVSTAAGRHTWRDVEADDGNKPDSSRSTTQ